MDVHVIPMSGWPLYRPDPRFTLGWTELRTHPLRPDMDEFYAVSVDGTEVARVHFDRRPMDLSPWPGAPGMGAAVVRVQLIEVAAGERGRGLGRAVVERLAARHAGARLVAVSVPEAAGFWTALGWQRFEHGRDRGRLPLYVAPALR